MFSIHYQNNEMCFMETGVPGLGSISKIWAKAEFETLAGVSLNPYRMITYEPGRDSYVVVLASDPYNAVTFTTPADNPALAWLEAHTDYMWTAAEQEEAAQRDYVKVCDTWVPRRETLSLADLRAEVLSDLNQVAFGALQTILALQNLAAQQGRDISTAVNSRVSQALSWLAARRLDINAIQNTASLLNYEIPTVADYSRADVDALMNLL